MSSTSKYFLAFFVAVLVVLGYRFYDYKVSRNYLLEVNASCDPMAEQCFVEEGVDEAIPYKKVVVTARYAPHCLEEHSCEQFSCPADATTCLVTYCNAEVLEAGEACYVPESASEPE